MVPHFYLVGAPKCGTTSLNGYLAAHPQLFCPAIKEPHFFACPEVKDTYYEAEFVDSREAYERLYADCPEGRLAGDFSTSYLFSTGAAERIHQARPDARIIMVLREPVDRAISHYLMDQRTGCVDLPLSRCLESTEMTRLFYKEYIEVGRYGEQIKRYTDLFPREQMLILLFDELRASNEETLRRIYRFLGVDEHVTAEVEDRNSHVSFRFGWLKGLLRNPLVQGCARLLPKSLRRGMLSMISSRKKPDFTDERRCLQTVFEGEAERLEKQIDCDLSAWKKTI